MKKIILVLVAMLFTAGCSVGNIDISKVENTEPSLRQPIELPENDTFSEKSTTNGEQISSPPVIPYSEVPKTAKLGERFCVIGPVNSGHLYVSINKCEVFDSLNEADMKYEDLMKALIVDDFNYDSSTTKFLKGFKMIKTYLTVENVDAFSYDNIYTPDDYGEYDFSMERIGGIPYATTEYLDLSSDKENYFKLHIEPNEKKEIIMGYLLDTRKVELEDAVYTNGDDVNTPKEIPYTVVDLELGGEI